MITKSKETLEKAEKLSKSMVKDLGDIVDLYFNNFEENSKKFEVANLQWKKHCFNVNRRQKLIKVPFDAFEKEIARIVAENPKFQPKKEVINLTQL